MDLLAAVNLILRKLGEIPVTSVDDQYPTLTIALAAIDESKTRVISEGYWFNTYYEYTLQPAVDGTVPVPDSTIKFFPKETRHVFTGSAIRLADSGSVYVKEAVVGRLIQDMPFTELPEVARQAIAYSAAADTYLADIGPDSTHQQLIQQRDMYVGQLNGDHTTSRKLNSRNRKQVMRYRQQLRT